MSEAADEDHRPEDVHERAGSSSCRAGSGEHHAPGFQIMSMRMRRPRPWPRVEQEPAAASASSSQRRGRARSPGRDELSAAREGAACTRGRSAAGLRRDRPQHDRRDHPAVPDLVRVEGDREPDAEDDRSDRARRRPRRCRPAATPAEARDLLGAARRVDVTTTTDPEEHDRADEREGAQQVEGEDPVVQLHAAQA